MGTGGAISACEKGAEKGKEVGRCLFCCVLVAPLCFGGGWGEKEENPGRPVSFRFCFFFFCGGGGGNQLERLVENGCALDEYQILTAVFRKLGLVFWYFFLCGCAFLWTPPPPLVGFTGKLTGKSPLSFWRINAGCGSGEP